MDDAMGRMEKEIDRLADEVLRAFSLQDFLGLEGEGTLPPLERMDSDAP
jgi:hypothetical protein